MKLPIIIAKDLNKGIIGMRNIKLGGFDVAIVWLKKKYETGTEFDIKDIDKFDAVFHFADKESLDVTIGILEKIKRDWR